MYIFKNAIRNIIRSKGRSILIGIIVTIIALSMCIGLSIRQAASNAKEEALADLNITATISPDREAAMEKGMGEAPDSSESSGGFDKSAMMEAMNESLSLEELQKYAEADSVKSFYYTMSASVNAAGDLEAYSTTEDTESDTSADSSTADSDQNSMGGGRGMRMTSSDFSIVGYSSDESMTDFVNGTCTITNGAVFEAGTSDSVCIISDELATYNSLAVGDVIQVSNPNNEEETYSLEIVGIYTNSQSSATAMSGGMGKGGFVDPANYIYTSYNTLSTIVDDSATANTDGDVSAISGTTNGTYVLGDMDAYEAFQSEVADLGLEDGYAVSSSDLTSYEQSAQPLENLAKFAGYFLIVILIIGAIILVVLNIFSTRERKYEIGVLAAIGMKKSKVAKQFVMEIMVIALAGVIVGGAIGAAVSVPVTNSLLASQIEASQENSNDRNAAFGRSFNEGGQTSDDTSSEAPSDVPSDSGDKVTAPGANYITSVSSAVNVTVLLELLVACIFLAMIAGTVSVVAIMRYEPLQILANRD